MKQLKYRAGYKYQLASDYALATTITGFSCETEFISLSADGWLLIKAGYAWDGASGPAIDTRSFRRGSMVHDALYQLIRLGLLPMECREQADVLLHTIVIEDKMLPVRAWWVYQAVRWRGGYAILPSSENPILLAP